MADSAPLAASPPRHSVIIAITEMVRDPRTPDLTMRQTAILACIAGADAAASRTVRALAARLAIPRPAVTRAADRLTEAGLVERAPDPADRRSVLILPTAKGRKFVSRFFGVAAI